MSNAPSGLPRGLDLLLATGGTGGHIYPALAVAAAARERGLEVGFLGQAGGMEARLVPEAGYPILGVAAGKWDRQRPDPLQAVRAVQGLAQAARAVRAGRPGLVVGFGGFAAFPGCAAAVLTGTKLALHEANAFPSRVTRWFAPRARLLIVAQPEAAARLRAREVVPIPYPVREVRVERTAARQALGLSPEATVTLVMGGSQGSLALNRAVPTAYRALLSGAAATSAAPLNVLHASGPRWLDEVRGSAADLEGYHVRPYVDAVQAFAAADLAITRAGMGTLSEAAFHGVPLVMVPLPTAAEDHQSHNARAVEAAGAGVMVPESELARLPDAWRRLLDAGTRRTAARAALSRSPEGAAGRILDALTPYLGRHGTAGPQLEGSLP